jgi:hypothetical protein
MPSTPHTGEYAPALQSQLPVSEPEPPSSELHASVAKIETNANRCTATMFASISDPVVACDRRVVTRPCT